nr:hypothetical protein BaRGS_021007 [Batillaria attramentaria]
MCGVSPLECLGSDGGVDYKGRTSVTINGRVCERWDQLDPGRAEYFPYSYYNYYYCYYYMYYYYCYYYYYYYYYYY